MSVNTIERKEKLISQLQEKEYRDAFVSEHIDTGIPFQIRAIRKKRGWTQKQLAYQAGMLQERISVAENPNYARFNLKTLKKIASAFDVALIVRFVPFSELVKWEINLSSEALEATSFSDDFKEMPQQVCATAYLPLKPTIYSYAASGGFVFGGTGVVNFLNPSQPSKPDITDLAEYRATRKKKKPEKGMESQLRKMMQGGSL